MEAEWRLFPTNKTLKGDTEKGELVPRVLSRGLCLVSDSKKNQTISSIERQQISHLLFTLASLFAEGIFILIVQKWGNTGPVTWLESPTWFDWGHSLGSLSYHFFKIFLFSLGKVFSHLKIYCSMCLLLEKCLDSSLAWHWLALHPHLTTTSFVTALLTAILHVILNGWCSCSYFTFLLLLSFLWDTFIIYFYIIIIIILAMPQVYCGISVAPTRGWTQAPAAKLSPNNLGVTRELLYFLKSIWFQYP